MLSDTILYCSPHLDAVFYSLKEFPYSEVKLFELVKSMMESGPRVDRKPCHLCTVIQQSEHIYLHALKEISSDASFNRRYGKANFHLCSSHAMRLFVGGADQIGRAGKKTRAGTVTRGERVLSPAEASSLLKQLAMVLDGFHLMTAKELRRSLSRLEALMKKAWKDVR